MWRALGGKALLAHVPLIAARGASTCYYQTRLPRRPALWTESLWGSQPLQSADSQFGYAACTVQNRLKKSPQWCPLPPISYVPLGYSKTRRFLSVFFCKNANPFYLGRALIVLPLSKAYCTSLKYCNIIPNWFLQRHSKRTGTLKPSQWLSVDYQKPIKITWRHKEEYDFTEENDDSFLFFKPLCLCIWVFYL